MGYGCDWDLGEPHKANLYLNHLVRCLTKECLTPGPWIAALDWSYPEWSSKGSQR